MSEAETPPDGNHLQINDARLERAAVLITESDQLHQNGDDRYRMAANEIIAARKADPKLSITRIARRIGKSRPWVRTLIERRESGESATSTPWIGKNGAGIHDRTVARRIAHDEPGITILRQMIRRTEEEMAGLLPEASDLEGRITRWGEIREVMMPGEENPEAEIPLHVRHYMEVMKHALSAIRRKDKALSMVGDFRTAVDGMVAARKRRDRAAADGDANGMLAAEYDEKREVLALSKSWRALHRLMLEDLEAE